MITIVEHALQFQRDLDCLHGSRVIHRTCSPPPPKKKSIGLDISSDVISNMSKQVHLLYDSE